MGLLEEKIATLRTERLVADAAEAAKAPVKGEVTEVAEVVAVRAEDVVLREADPAEVAAAKAEVHLDAWLDGLEFTHEGAHITVQRVEVRDGALWVWLRANVPTSNPYVFVNPPLQVEAGRDDPEAALRGMVGQTVVSWARKQGWRR